MVKKNIMVMGLCLFMATLVPAFSQNNSDESYTQVLIPREVYVGDTGRIEYSFRSPVDLFALASEKRINGDILTFDVNSPVFAAVSDRCTVQKAILIRNGLSYNLVIDLIPWKPGIIDFPQVDLTQLCNSGAVKEEESEQAAFYVDIAPINIASIVSRLGVTSISPPQSPILLPGTNYVVWCFSILGVLIFFGIGICIVKFRQIAGFFYKLKTRIGLFRNSFSTKRKIRRLLKRKLSDVEFSNAWQMLMKNYLEYRFHVPFASVTSRRISSVISRAVGDMLNEAQENAIEYIVTIFVRTDYIKFANGSIDSRLLPLEEHEAVFAQDEKKKIVEMSESAINRLEILNDEEQEKTARRFHKNKKIKKEEKVNV